eukprot:scaffold197101_cov33-Tisochrysis_lutea.AAC.4
MDSWSNMSHAYEHNGGGSTHQFHESLENTQSKADLVRAVARPSCRARKTTMDEMVAWPQN